MAQLRRSSFPLIPSPPDGVPYALVGERVRPAVAAVFGTGGKATPPSAITLSSNFTQA
jgi:hypothetical protein